LVDCDDDDNDDNAGDSNGNGNGKGDLPYNKPVWSMPPNIIYNTIFACCSEEGKRMEGRCQDINYNMRAKLDIPNDIPCNSSSS
jgi:hypothetical protein